MRRGNFFRRNQYKIAAVCVLAAILGLAGISMLNSRSQKQEPMPQQAEIAKSDKTEEKAAKKAAETETKEDAKVKRTVRASTVIKPKKQAKIVVKEEENMDEKKEVPQIQETAAVIEEPVPEELPQTVETAAAAAPAPIELHFDAQAGLLWPVEGSVILDYSMDQTVYFTTLDQYKYNPAVIIAGNVNDKVQTAASGKIMEIATNEVTGCTVKMDIGDGYTAIYGQLKEVPFEAGAYLEAGDTIGFVSEPTKYYSLEGSNLYFALEKDGIPVDPVEFFRNSSSALD